MTMVRELARSHGNEHTVVADAEGFEVAFHCANPVIGALIAFVDDQPAGSVVWHRSFSTHRGQEVMYLEDLVVLPSFRRQGIARALLRELARLAVEKNYLSIYWLVMGWNTGAHELYASVGADVEADYSVCRLHGDKLLALTKS